MRHRSIFVAGLVLVVASGLWAGGSEETSDYGPYAAAEGLILRPDQVNIDSIVAELDYYYPYPREAVGVELFVGNRRLVADGSEELIQIGIQGRAIPFSELRPMDLIVVLDGSESMAGEEEYAWALASLDLLLQRLRPVDRIALVHAADGEARTLLRLEDSTPARAAAALEHLFLLEAHGPSALGPGLEAALDMAGFESGTDRSSRVLLLSDGMGLTPASVDIAIERARAIGIGVSTVGYGIDYNLAAMRRLGIESGGTGRFIADREDMQEHFVDELDRMVYPVATELALEVRLRSGLSLQAAWSYDNRPVEDGVEVFIPSLHNRDYETVLLEVRLPTADNRGRLPIAELAGTYRDATGEPQEIEPRSLDAVFLERPPGTTGYSDPVVLRSGSALGYAKTLRRIGAAYHGGSDRASRSGPLPPDRLQALMEDARETRNRLENARLRLSDTIFDDYIGLLDDYIQTLGNQADLSETEIEVARTSTEILPDDPSDRVAGELLGRIEPLALEVSAVLGALEGVKRLYIGEFLFRESGRGDLSLLVSQVASRSLAARPDIQLVNQDAQFALTGTIVEMGRSVIAFAELIDLASGRLLCVSQVVLPKSQDVLSLLESAPLDPPPGELEYPGAALRVVSLDPVFPARLSVYERNPFGVLEIENRETGPLTDVTVTFFAGRVMERPVLGRVPDRIAAGASAQAEILALFTVDVLDIRERRRINADIEVRYKHNGSTRRASISTILVVENRNALTWDDDRAAAGFVTARDPEVLRVARNIVNDSSRISPGEVDGNLLRAAAIYEAVRAFGITYVIDPATPFDLVSTQSGVVDFVQYPKETFQYRSGDCDDLSVLHAALFEAVGIPTAFVTIPGHLYIAFALDGPSSRSLRPFSDPGRFILHDDRAWVPLELTARNAGFAEAWDIGARAWTTHRARAQARILPTRPAWQVFPPVDPPVPERPIDFPGGDAVRSVVSASIENVIETEVGRWEAAFADRIEGRRGSRLAGSFNALGIVYALYGRYDQAVLAFERALEEEPRYSDARINLGHVRLLQDQLEEAAGDYRAVLESEPDNTGARNGLAAVQTRLNGLGAIDDSDEVDEGSAVDEGREGRASGVDAVGVEIEWQSSLFDGSPEGLLE